MKRIISIILCLVCLCTLLALPVAAAPTDPLAVKFQEFLNTCDILYSGNIRRHVRDEAAKAFVSEANPGPVEVPGDKFEAELAKYVVVTDAFLQEFRSSNPNMYNPETQKYTLNYGGMGGVTAERLYKGYVKTSENTYDVYYQAFEREDLKESTEFISKYKNPITKNVEYNGKTYMRDADGYYCVKNWKDGGNKYSIELIDGKMRFISVESFGAGTLPATFDDAVVKYELPKDNTVYLDDVAGFPDKTTVKVEKITDKVQQIAQAMARVSTKYVSYEFTAVQNGVSVQPSGKLRVYFALPEDFSDNTVVMYMAPDGKLTELASMVKNSDGKPFVDAELSHFSTYILVDKDAKQATQPTVTPTEGATTASTIAATQATVGDTKATAAVTTATGAATNATNPATKDTVAPATRPIGVTVGKPTVPATGDAADSTAETTVDPTDETAVAPTEDVAPTGETSAAPTAAHKPGKSNKTGGLIAAVIIVVLAGGGFAAWWFFFRKKEVMEETEVTGETEETKE